jgi:hypothetical protein
LRWTWKRSGRYADHEWVQACGFQAEAEIRGLLELVAPWTIMSSQTVDEYRHLRQSIIDLALEYARSPTTSPALTMPKLDTLVLGQMAGPFPLLIHRHTWDRGWDYWSHGARETRSGVYKLEDMRSAAALIATVFLVQLRPTYIRSFVVSGPYALILPPRLGRDLNIDWGVFCGDFTTEGVGVTGLTRGEPLPASLWH